MGAGVGSEVRVAGRQRRRRVGRGDRHRAAVGGRGRAARVGELDPGVEAGPGSDRSRHVGDRAGGGRARPDHDGVALGLHRRRAILAADRQRALRAESDQETFGAAVAAGEGRVRRKLRGRVGRAEVDGAAVARQRVARGVPRGDLKLRGLARGCLVGQHEEQRGQACRRAGLDRDLGGDAGLAGGVLRPQRVGRGPGRPDRDLVGGGDVAEGGVDGERVGALDRPAKDGLRAARDRPGIGDEQGDARRAADVRPGAGSAEQERGEQRQTAHRAPQGLDFASVAQQSGAGHRSMRANPSVIWPRARPLAPPRYSKRSASIGSSREARRAG